MIVDTIRSLIGRMTAIRALEEIKANNEQQQKADERYRSLVKEVGEFVRAYAFAKEQLSFVPSDALANDLTDLLSKLKEMVSNGIVDIEMAIEIQKRFTRLKTQMRTEWESHYSRYTPTIETLRVIEGIDAEKVKKCLSEIKHADSWTGDRSSLERFAKAVSDSRNLIYKLELDDTIIKFLQKMTSGDARVSDLDYDLILWMKKEGIEDKVSLSFVS